MAKKDSDELAEAVAEEAKPAVENAKLAARPNDVRVAAPFVPGSTLATRAGKAQPEKAAEPASGVANSTFAERAAARNKRVKADQTTSK